MPPRPLRLLAGFLLAFALAGPALSAPVYGYEVVRTYPHDRGAFTEGLFYLGGFLYESTGLEGASSIRKVRLETGEVLQTRAVPAAYFGEGIVADGDRLLELTWKNEVGFIYDLKSFEPRAAFRYPGEGWALTRDARRLIMSDGTAQLRFLDPKTLRETGRMTVRDEGRPVDNLNELEWIRGEIWANIWRTDRIARIDPATGRVIAWMDMSGLLSPADRAGGPVDVLNGIAWDPRRDRIFVTGKFWPKLFEIRPGRRLSEAAR